MEKQTCTLIMDFWMNLTKYKMKNHISIISLLLLLLLLQFLACGNTKNKTNEINNNCFGSQNTLNIEGDWGIDLIPEILFIEKDTAYMSIIEGQIHIKAIVNYENNVRNKAYLKLIEPTFLGLGGARLNWKSFSHKINIAVINLVAKDSLRFEWLGFYDNKLAKNTFPVCGFTNVEQNWCYLTRIKD